MYDILTGWRDATQKAMEPDSVSELCAFLGLCNYYRRLLPKYLIVLVPLHKFLCRGSKMILVYTTAAELQTSEELYFVSERFCPL